MLLRSYIPGPPLGDFVEQFWLCLDAPAQTQGRILPHGTIELVVNLCDDEIRIHDPTRPDRCRRHSGAVVCGAYGGAFVTDYAQSAQHTSIVGVHFRPGGAFPFLGVPACELADTHVDLDALWGRTAAELRERLRAAATPAERFSLLEQTLVARLDRMPDRHGAVPVALAAFEQTGTRVRVRDVARRVGLSQRRFIQVFAAEVGLTPKLYGRVRRFQQTLALVRDIPAPDWARVAADCGYFDQSHLIRDFRAFSGLTPEEYQSLRRRNEHVLHNHVLQTG
jgi:AraC-like DNA-binding protein